ncbi:MAG TPA: hypothetical protein VGM83_18340 [Devosiaceae bacterium]|jgi:hypothetical protein
MKIVFAVGMAVLAMTPMARAAQPVACNVTIDITDTDPLGTNVRAAPGGAVATTLKNSSEDGWIEVHVTGQSGDWFRIDGATLIAPNADDKAIFSGAGYLHKSVVGVSGFENGAPIYADHDTRSRAVDPAAAGDQAVDVLGCWGDFLKVHVEKGTGWTQRPCTNMVTTCS